MASKTMTLGTGTIGPSKWRNNTLKEIKLSENVIHRSDRSCELGRSVDPLPHLRDVVAELSNDEAHRYFRDVRVVVSILRESLIDTNEEIKSLTRGREALEKTLEHIRKDIKLNRDSRSVRVSRPTREKTIDGADDLLHAEGMHLNNLKKSLETQLQATQRQLQWLNNARRRLSAVLQERSRVQDLICAAIPSSSASATRSIFAGGRQSGMGYGLEREKTDFMSCNAPPTDPLGPYTPETEAALLEAKDARSNSASLRQDISNLIDKANKTQRSAHKSVNYGLTSKIAETVGLKQHLDVAHAENQHAQNRANRWYESTEKAWGYAKGPSSSADFACRERLTRPIVSVFQRHPGTNLPEAQEIIRGNDGLLQSLQNTSRNIGLMKLAQLKLRDDISDKRHGLEIDSSVLRMRRRKADHRWVMSSSAF